MKHMTLSEFIDSESDEPVFIVDGPRPIVGTACVETAKRWRVHASLSLHQGGKHSAKANQT